MGPETDQTALTRDGLLLPQNSNYTFIIQILNLIGDDISRLYIDLAWNDYIKKRQFNLN